MSRPIRNRKELETAILELENRKRVQQLELKYQFNATWESLKPGNIIREGFQKLVHTKGLPEGMIKTAAGLSAGMLTKKLFFNSSSSILSKLFGTALDLTIAKTAVNNTDKIKAYAIATYNNLFKKNNRTTIPVMKAKINNQNVI